MLNNYYLSTALFLSMYVMLFIAYLSWKHRKIPIASKIGMIMLASSFYTAGYAHEVILSDLEEIKFCILVKYLGIPFIPAFWLFLIIEYTYFQYFTKKWSCWFLFIIPVLTLILPGLDLTPFVLTLSGILLIWIIYRYNLWVTHTAFEKIFAAMTDGVVILDLANQVIKYNEPAGVIIPELNHITSKQNNSENVFNNYPVIEEILKQTVPYEKIFTMQRENVLKIYRTKLIFINDRKHSMGKIMIFEDITVNENNMGKLAAASAQLAALNTVKDRLIGIVAGDIREPLFKLSELMKQETDKKLLVKEVQKQVGNIFYKADNVLEHFQNKQTSIIYSPMKWKLTLLIQEAVNTISEKAEKKNIGIRLDLQDNLSVFADKEMLIMVLRNLLSNAVKFTNRNGNITVTARKDKSFIIISVEDTGIGMEPEKIQMLFQDIECSPAAGTEGEGGIGIGLLLCRQMIQLNHGDIWVDSTLGEGSNFFISVPAFYERNGYEKNITR